MAVPSVARVGADALASVARMNCPHCDATILETPGETCPNCGRAMHGAGSASLPVAIVVSGRGERLPATALAPATPASAHAPRFALARQDPRLNLAMEEPLVLQPLGARFYARCVVRLGVGLACTVGCWALLGPWFTPVALGPVLMTCIPLFFELRGAWRTYGVPITRHLVCVVDVGGGTYVVHDDHDHEGPGRIGIDRTITVEFEDGRRRRLDTSRPVIGTFTAGNIGVAYIQGDVLVIFARLLADSPPGLPRSTGADEQGVDRNAELADSPG